MKFFCKKSVLKKFFAKFTKKSLRDKDLNSKIVGNLFSFAFCKTFQNSHSIDRLWMVASKNIVSKLI